MKKFLVHDWNGDFNTYSFIDNFDRMKEVVEERSANAEMTAFGVVEYEGDISNIGYSSWGEIVIESTGSNMIILDVNDGEIITDTNNLIE